jgi:hypothetical protein
MVERLDNIKKDFTSAMQLMMVVGDENRKPIKHVTEQELFDVYLNSKYFHSDSRGFQYFYQYPQSAQQTMAKIFQFGLARYVLRLKAYMPIVARTVDAGLVPLGAFRVSLQKVQEGMPQPAPDEKFRFFIPMNENES